MYQTKNQKLNSKVVPFEQKTSPRQSDHYSKLSLIKLLSYAFPIVFAGLALRSYMDATADQKLAEENLQEAEIQLNKVQEKNAIIKDEYALSQDEEYVAKVARRDYYYSKPDEIIFDIETNDEKQEIFQEN